MSSPQIRRKSRCRALEFLFGLEFTGEEWRPAIEPFWETFDTKETARAYAEILIGGVMEQRENLDARIDGALTNWKPERVGRIERTLLRMALYEMSEVDDVPVNVSMNEAIELAKLYGTDESPGFVNAVLDRLRRSEFRESPA